MQFISPRNLYFKRLLKAAFLIAILTAGNIRDLFGLLAGGELRDDDAGKNQRAARVGLPRHMRVEYQNAANHAENRFHRKDDGRYRRIGILLPERLTGVCHAD